MATWRHRLMGPITKSDYKYRLTTLFIPIIAFSFLSYEMLRQSSRSLEDISVTKGQLSYKEVLKERYKGNNYRYTFVFRLNTLTQSLGIALGSGESAIEEGEYWDKKVSLGDNLKVYYDNNFITESENITRLIYKIERDNEVIYQTGTRGKRIMGFSFLGLDILFVGLAFWIRKRHKMYKGRIEAAANKS